MANSVVEYGARVQAGPSYSFQRDSFLRSFESKVIECNPWSIPSEIDNKRKGGNNGKTNNSGSKKKGKNANKKEETFYEVICADTILFAEGGGQPTDHGTFQLTNDPKSREIEVLSVLRRAHDGKVLHKTQEPFEVGSAVTIKVNWRRRYDHMQQHSAQHLISAVFRNRLQTPTKSWWMSEWPKPSQIEMECKHSESITEQQIAGCETAINEVISAGKPMTVHIFHEQSAVDAFAAQHSSFTSKDLPPNTGPLRVIEIPDVEYNTCCGTHVANTRQLQMVKIVSFDVDAKNGMLRINFVAGDRMMANFESMFRREKAIGKMLSSGNEEFVGNIDKTQKDLKAKSSQLRLAEKRLMELEIARLVSDVELRFKQGQATVCVYEHFGINGSMKLLQGISDGVLNEVHQKHDNALLVFLMFTMGLSTKSGQYIIATNDAQLLSAKNKETKQQILSFIDGAGGGRPGRLQGKANRFKGCTELFQFVETASANSNKAPTRAAQQSEKPMKDALSGLTDVIDLLDK